MSRSHLARSSRRIVPPIVVAALLWALGHAGAARVAAAIALVLLIIGLVAPTVADRLDHAITRLSGAVAVGVSTVLSSLAWLVIVLPVWGWTRMGGRSPLADAWIRPRCAWTAPPTDRSRTSTGVLVGARRSGAHEPTRPARTPRQRAACGLAACSVVIVGVWIAVGLTERPMGWPLRQIPEVASAAGGGPGPRQAERILATEFDGLPVDDYAHEDEPWAPEYFGEMLQLGYVLDPFLGATLTDFDGRYVNVVDGRRVSYTPDDPELTVWFFGGSTTFGIGQRDEHTIPSVVARAAEQDGIHIRSENFGVAGYVNWQGTEAFEQALTSSLEPPDLVVFYDGVNDRGLASQRAEMGDSDPRRVSRLALSDEERAEFRSTFGNVPEVPWTPERDELEIELAATQYRRGAELARELGESFGVPVVHAWQPQPFARPAHPSDDPLWERLDFDPDHIEGSTRTYDLMRERSGVDPIDLSGVLDDVDVPVFLDSSHTNELGARIIGEAMYHELEPQIESILADRRQSDLPGAS